MKLFILIIIFFLTSCIRVTPKETIKILMPNGAPSLAQIKIEQDIKEIEGYNIEINRVGDPKLLGAGFSGDEYDIIYAPINMGVKEYNKTKKFKVLSSITNGNIYLVSKKSSLNINDINNKPLYLFGQGTVNDSLIKHILNINNIKPSKINYLASTQDTLKQFVTSTDDGIYMIAEPILSAKLMNSKVETYSILDINKILEANDINFIQAAVFYKENLDTKFIDEYYKLLEESIHFVNNDREVLNYIKNSNIGLPNNINLDIISRCNIKLTRLNKDILNKLIDLDPNKFGGKPDEAFYY